MFKTFITAYFVLSTALYADIEWLDEKRSLFSINELEDVDQQVLCESDIIFLEDGTQLCGDFQKIPAKLFSDREVPFDLADISAIIFSKEDPSQTKVFTLDGQSYHETVMKKTLFLNGIDPLLTREINFILLKKREDEILMLATDFDLEEETEEEQIVEPSEEIEFIATNTVFPESRERIAETDFELDDLYEEEEELEPLPPLYVEALEVEDQSDSEIVFIATGTSHTEAMDEYPEIAELETSAKVAGQSYKRSFRADAPEKGASVKRPFIQEKEVSYVGMVFIPPNNPEDSSYYLSNKLITNREYERFLQAINHPPPPHWVGGKIPKGKEDDPVVNVSYKEAYLYVVWAGKRLPTLEELERAGNEIDDVSKWRGEWTSTPVLKKVSDLFNPRAGAHIGLSTTTTHKIFSVDSDKKEWSLQSEDLNGNIGFRVASDS